MAKKKLSSQEQWVGTKKYRVRWGDLTEPDKKIVSERGPYDDREIHIESDGMYEDFGNDKKGVEEKLICLKHRAELNKYDDGEKRIEEYYRRQRSNRGKKYSTKKQFNIRDLVF